MQANEWTNGKQPLPRTINTMSLTSYRRHWSNVCGCGLWRQQQGPGVRHVASLCRHIWCPLSPIPSRYLAFGKRFRCKHNENEVNSLEFAQLINLSDLWFVRVVARVFSHRWSLFCTQISHSWFQQRDKFWSLIPQKWNSLISDPKKTADPEPMTCDPWSRGCDPRSHPSDPWFYIPVMTGLIWNCFSYIIAFILNSIIYS